METVHLAYRHISEDTISSAILEFEILSDLNSDYYTALELLKLYGEKYETAIKIQRN